MTATQNLGQAGLLLLLGLFACGEDPPPEERLEQAARHVQAAEERLAEADEEVVNRRDQLDERREAVERAQQQLAHARRQFRNLEEELLDRSERLERRASDVALFRLVQQRLIDEPALEGHAISVHVSDGVVTLDGEVDTPEQRAIARTIAVEAPGVDGVRVLVDVSGDGQK